MRSGLPGLLSSYSTSNSTSLVYADSTGGSNVDSTQSTADCVQQQHTLNDHTGSCSTPDIWETILLSCSAKRIARDLAGAPADAVATHLVWYPVSAYCCSQTVTGPLLLQHVELRRAESATSLTRVGTTACMHVCTTHAFAYRMVYCVSPSQPPTHPHVSIPAGPGCVPVCQQVWRQCGWLLTHLHARPVD